MQNLRPAGDLYQYVTSPSGESLRSNLHVRCSKRIRKYSHQYETVFGSSREWNSDAIASIVYMIQYGYFNKNEDTDDILSLLGDWDKEDYMDLSSMFHMR